MKEEKIHKLLLKVAIATFGMGVIISVIVTSIVFTSIHRGEIRELEEELMAGGFQATVTDGEVGADLGEGDNNGEAAIDDEGDQPESQDGRRVSVEIVPEILAGGIVTQLLEGNDVHWYLKLVNSEHPVDADFVPVLAEIVTGHFVDSRIYTETMEMLESASNAGLDLLIISSYRSYYDQMVVFNNVMNQWIGEGLNLYQAYLATRTTVALPGHSEHAIGLALDIVSASNPALDETQATTPEGQWLRDNSWRYGFVLRYPEYKSHITGIAFEPWHFRFVGRQSAQVMWERDIVLEEYLLERHLLSN
jgi:LAS superfamily LD-carboxypeptidase LdcB